MASDRIAILRLGDHLLASLQGEMDDAELSGFEDELLEHISATHARGVVLEVSKLELVDSYTSRVLMELVAACRLVGARVVVAGMRPAVAITMATHGVGLPGVDTAISLADAMARLDARTDHV